MCKLYFLFTLSLFLNINLNAQNLVQNGGIVNSNASWNGQEAPFNATTYQGSYITACGNNYVMEVDNASVPTQTLNGFISGLVYQFNCRYAYRTSCAPSVNPTVLRILFTDAPSVLDFTIAVSNTVTNFLPLTFTFTNNSALSHTLQFSNPGNANTCGIILDDISIIKYASPGGVSTTSLSMWFKSETLSQPNNSDVYAWNSVGSSALTLTASCAARPQFRTGLASFNDNLIANFNPFITFNGTSQYLAYEVNRQAFFDASAGGNGTTFFEVFQGGTAGRTVFGYRGSNNSRIEAKSDSLVISDGASAGTNNNLGYLHSSRVNIVAATGKHNGLTISDVNGVNQTLANNSIDTDHLTIGARKTSSLGAFNRFFNGSVSEFIGFNGVLSEIQMHRVRSYLAMKYGVTLGENAATGLSELSYQSSIGTLVWTYASNSGFHNNVTVIGRDDGSGLNQVRSISTDSDLGSNTGNAMLDIDNVSAISSDQSFLAVGHNGTVIPNPGGADFSDVPAGIQSRLRRVWKFQKTGSGIGNNVNVRFDMTGFAPLTGSQLRLIVSTSTVFSGASIFTGTYSAPFFTASLPNTGGVYFTVASTNSVSTPLPVELMEFNVHQANGHVLLNWKVTSERDIKSYVVQKSNNAVQFMELDTVLPIANQDIIKEYSSIDTLAYAGLNYYRLKIIDYDGSFKYSPQRSINVSDPNQTFILHPNPNNGEFSIITAYQSEFVIRIYDSYGKQLYEEFVDKPDPLKPFVQNHFKLKLKPGIYFCRFGYEQKENAFKFIVK